MPGQGCRLAHSMRPVPCASLSQHRQCVAVLICRACMTRVSKPAVTDRCVTHGLRLQCSSIAWPACGGRWAALAWGTRETPARSGPPTQAVRMQAALSSRRAWTAGSDGLSLPRWGSLQLHIIDCCTMSQCTTCCCRAGMGNILDLPYWRQYVTSIYYVVTTITTTGYGGEPQPCACLSQNCNSHSTHTECMFAQGPARLLVRGHSAIKPLCPAACRLV